MSMHEVSALLWAERELLEALLFKLEEEQLLLTSGRTRWLPRATQEIDAIQQKLRETGLARAVEVETVATEWGAPTGTSLRELTEKAPDGPWAEILTSHANALTGLVSEIKNVQDSNEHLIRGAIRSTQETLADASTSTSIYNAHGVTDTGRSASHLFDKEL